MNKFEYFILSIRSGEYLKRQWGLQTFGILLKDDSQNGPLKLSANNTLTYTDVDGTDHIIQDYITGQPLFGREERIKIPKGTIDSTFISQDIDSTYGLLLLNALLLWYPYRGKVHYQNQAFNSKFLNDLGYNLIIGGTVTPEEHQRFENAISHITYLTGVGVPSATKKSITPNPEAIVLRDKLLKENKDSLDDPATVAKIQKELATLDREYLKGDPSERFFIKSKSYDVTRLRSFGIYGAEQDFRDESKISLVTPNLSEGWEFEDLPVLNNVVRAGTHARGVQTALGGEGTKITTRIFQNSEIIEDDCGSPIGLKITFHEDTYQMYVGRTLVGDSTPLTYSRLENLLGQPLELRSPRGCRTDGTGFCKVCMGESVTRSEVGLNAHSVTASSSFMSIFMAAMHGRALKTARFNYKRRIS